ncbi:hypothetical protein Vqi01_21790 [Micromonospora qiuiae]|uniref:Uncharacterized protein n=1 Tax=Micromonospora qiuiae TaxID=502268 RepID=A0ABQ4JA94_9ACTN|nr:hypothetical protein Vqi01_21790 [Micromonospora qiuiae]
MRWRGAGAGRHASKVVVQKEQQEGEQVSPTLLGPGCAFVRPEIVVVLPGAWGVGNRKDEVCEDAA